MGMASCGQREGEVVMLDELLRTAPALDHAGLDLDAAERVTYLLAQQFRYDYAQPVHRLRHRLVVLPPARHGNQHLRARSLAVDGADIRRSTRQDAGGNTVVRIRADRVERAVQFQIGALVERVQSDGATRLPAAALGDPRLLRPTPLTAPDARLRELAWQLGRDEASPLELADRICREVHSTIAYEHGVTSIETTAAQALAGARGVCQDAAHVMLALCHLLALPARYVSGHLLGQGGTHAWVEVVTPFADHAIATAFDPCNGRRGSAHYVTVATGRDYKDIAPTSGTYVGIAGGNLTATRRLAVIAAA
jgi:transglutaminase-like putative cysteine protease